MPSQEPLFAGAVRPLLRPRSGRGSSVDKADHGVCQRKLPDLGVRLPLRRLPRISRGECLDGSIAAEQVEHPEGVGHPFGREGRWTVGHSQTKAVIQAAFGGAIVRVTSLSDAAG